MTNLNINQKHNARTSLLTVRRPSRVGSSLVVAMAAGFICGASGWTLAQSATGQARGAAQQTEMQRQKVSQQNQQTPQTQQELNKEFTPQLIRANKLIGMDVRNHLDQELGEIDEVVLGADREKISYLVISRGGFLDIGDELFAVPYDAFELSPVSQTALLNVTKEAFQTAPGFDDDEWPTSGNPEWQQKVDQFYKDNVDPSTRDAAREVGREIGEATERAGDAIERGTDEIARETQSAGERVLERTREERNEMEQRIEAKQEQAGVDEARERGAPHLRQDDWATDQREQMREEGEEGLTWGRRLTRVIGLEVKNPDETSLGEIEDLVIDLHEGRVVISVLSLGSWFDWTDEYVFVPWNEIDLRTNEKIAVLDIDKAELRQARFPENDWPNINDPQIASQVFDRFDREPYWVSAGYVSNGTTGQQDAKARDGQTNAWSPGSEYNQLFSADNVTTITGTIDGIGTFRVDRQTVPGLRLRVATQDQDLMTVHLGPIPFLREEGLRLGYGDQVTITGASVRGNQGSIMIASQIETPDDSLRLRDEQGEPRWDASNYSTESMRRERMMNRPESGMPAGSRGAGGAENRQNQNRNQQNQNQQGSGSTGGSGGTGGGGN